MWNDGGILWSDKLPDHINLIAFEMFGFKGVPFYLIAVSISYAASGYYGLYKDQTIVYSKYKAKYVNKPTRF